MSQHQTAAKPVDAPQVHLAVQDVHKDYATAAGPLAILKGIAFEMQGGESLAITGPSGSGKSTLLQMIGTLDAPSRGDIVINGQHPFALAEGELAHFRNRTIGFVFQEHYLLPQYSVLENVLLPTLAFQDGQDRRQRALELLRRVRLEHRLEHRPSQLSGGERQRVAVARALINRPTLLLCDEPTGSLDQNTAAAVGELLMELHRSEPTIYIAVTHSLDLAATFDRRFELREGLCYEP